MKSFAAQGFEPQRAASIAAMRGEAAWFGGEQLQGVTSLRLWRCRIVLELSGVGIQA